MCQAAPFLPNVFRLTYVRARTEVMPRTFVGCREIMSKLLVFQVMESDSLLKVNQ